MSSETKKGGSAHGHSRNQGRPVPSDFDDIFDELVNGLTAMSNYIHAARKDEADLHIALDKAAGELERLAKCIKRLRAYR